MFAAFSPCASLGFDSKQFFCALEQREPHVPSSKVTCSIFWLHACDGLLTDLSGFLRKRHVAAYINISCTSRSALTICCAQAVACERSQVPVSNSCLPKESKQHTGCHSVIEDSTSQGYQCKPQLCACIVEMSTHVYLQACLRAMLYLLCKQVCCCLCLKFLATIRPCSIHSNNPISDSQTLQA